MFRYYTWAIVSPLAAGQAVSSGFPPVGTSMAMVLTVGSQSWKPVAPPPGLLLPTDSQTIDGDRHFCIRGRLADHS